MINCTIHHRAVVQPTVLYQSLSQRGKRTSPQSKGPFICTCICLPFVWHQPCQAWLARCPLFERVQFRNELCILCSSAQVVAVDIAVARNIAAGVALPLAVPRDATE